MAEIEIEDFVLININMLLLTKISKYFSYSAWYTSFQRPSDLPSMSEMITNHSQLLGQGECKYFRTTDEKTITIISDLLKGNQFLQENIMGDKMSQNSFQIESLKVKICDIEKHSEQRRKYEEWKNEGRNRMICIGGPAASTQTFVASLIPEIKQKTEIRYYCRSHQESNVFHSAMCFIPRYGCSLNVSSSMTGRNLIPLVLKRLINKPDWPEIVSPNFLKVDVNIWNYRYFWMYFLNEVNGIVQNIKHKMGWVTEHQITRLEASVSCKMQKILEKRTNLKFTSYQNNSNFKPMSLQIYFEGNNEKKITQQFYAYQKEYPYFRWEQVPVQEIKSLFPESQKVCSVYRSFDDDSNLYDSYAIEREKSRENGTLWQENKSLSKVYVRKGEKKPEFCGVEFTDGEFVPADKAHLTLGYKALYQFEGSQCWVLDGESAPSTGVSCTMLLRMNGWLKEVVKENGWINIATSKVHWTTMACNDEYMILRATAGGNTGSEKYPPQYFINLCEITRSIFGSSFIGVFSTYGCVRAVSHKNSTQFAKLAEGLLISHGKGGTGSMKRCSQAYKGLKRLGYGQEVSNYFEGETFNDQSISDLMQFVISEGQKCNLFYDQSPLTSKVLFK